MKILLCFVLFFNLFNAFGQITSNQIKHFNKIFPAITKIESNNNVLAHNKKEDARGICQIRKNYLIDSNFQSKLNYSHDDCFDFHKSKLIVFYYFMRYGSQELEEGNYQALAKLHNGGPNWKRKTGNAKKNLDSYWKKIKNHID